MIRKRKPGRPPLPKAERKSRNLTFRARGNLYNDLQFAAEHTGRSISEEIETRLITSFEKDLIQEAVSIATAKARMEILEAMNPALDLIARHLELMIEQQKAKQPGPKANLLGPLEALMNYKREDKS